jgi:S-adenosylhomocysteine hydrolase
MTPEQRLRRLERVTKMLINKGRRARTEWREQSREQAEKINILIHMQMKTDEQIEKLAVAHAELTVAQAELTKSQDRTDRALRAFINSLRKGRNGESSN